MTNQVTVTLTFKSAEEARDALSKLLGTTAVVETQAEEKSTIRASDLKEKAAKKAKKAKPVEEEELLDDEDLSNDPADFEEDEEESDDEMEFSDIEDEEDFEEEKPAAKKKAKAAEPAKKKAKSVQDEEPGIPVQTLIDALGAYNTRLSKKHGEDKAVKQCQKILKEFGAASPRGVARDQRQAFLDRIAPKKA